MHEHDDRVRRVLDYHDLSRHDPQRYAPWPGQMEWDTQPDPFRRFEGAPHVLLDLFNDDEGAPPYEALYRDGVKPVPLDHVSVSRFLFFGLALSAGKHYRDREWSLRVNPSSGNLHPIECYLITDVLGEPSLYHYAPESHSLEQRARFGHGRFARLRAGLPDGTFIVGLSFIPWRESWKYGVRAFRYCQQDMGHAIGALRFSAAMLGWGMDLLPTPTDDDVERVLGLDRDDASHPYERELPALLAAVGPATSQSDARALEWPTGLVAEQWDGQANRLSPGYRDWPDIDEVAQACRQDVPVAPEACISIGPIHVGIDPCPHSAPQIIRQRRSAMEMDGRTALSRDRFYQMLLRVMPQDGVSPFDALYWQPRIHLGLFVHRVDGLTPGLYALVRNAQHVDDLRAAMRSEFAWRSPASCPDGLPLYLLSEEDVRATARSVSFNQEIASEGVFAAAMLGHFEPALRSHGAWLYRHLHWEAGLVGQTLYLDAEAAGIRATGIGAYFDQATHAVFGLTDRTFASVYHFTVGGPVDDPRLTTLPALVRS